jgi:hypothetical protein
MILYGTPRTSHLGTYWGMDTWNDVPEIMNTNMTYVFSYADKLFHKARPMDRPPKRCGVRMVYDEMWGHSLACAGGFHNYDFGYRTPNIRLSKFVDCGPGGEEPYPIMMWAFNGASQQWYAMRPLKMEGLPPAKGTFEGYYFNMIYSKEYALSLVVPPKSGRIYSYSAYLNQWTWLPRELNQTDVPPEIKYTCVCYDLKHKKLIMLYGNTTTHDATWAFDVGTHLYTKLAVNRQPTNGSTTSLWGAKGGISYDRKNGVIIYLKDDGTQTWALNLDDLQWRNMSPT